MLEKLHAIFVWHPVIYPKLLTEYDILINAGISQGSVLGLLLFLVCDNKIADTLLSTTKLFSFIIMDVNEIIY